MDELKYPYHFKYEGNPLVRHIGAADPDVHVWDDVVWMYTSQNHHSIIEFKDQWCYFYHIAIPEYPHFKESQGRIACYDKLFYNVDGTIQMVFHTRGSTDRDAD